MQIKPLAALAASVALGATLAACSSMPMMGEASSQMAPPAAPMPSPAAPMGMSGRPDADMQAVLDAHAALGAKPIETLTVQQARTQPSPADAVMKVKQMRNMPTAPDATVTTRDLTYPTGGTTQPVRVYKPANATGSNLPVVVYYHGGGWVIGDLDTHEVVCQKLAHEGELIVISVDYRLAPEHRFPAAVDDAVTATRWVAANAGDLGIDAARIGRASCRERV